MKSTNAARWFIYLLIALTILALLWGYGSSATATEEISISQLAQEIEANKVAQITVNGDGRTVTIEYQDSDRSNATANISENSSLEEQLASYSVSLDANSENTPIIIYQTPNQWSSWIYIISLFLPVCRRERGFV